MKTFSTRIYFIIAVLAFCVTINIGNGDAASKTLKIAMVLWRGETAAEKGFKAELANMGYRVTYTNINADQDISRLADFVRNENKFKGYDYVYAFGTTVSKFLIRIIDEKTPIIFNVVTAPVEAGLVNSMCSSGKNISGVSNIIPLDLEIQNALNTVSFKKLGLFFNPREKNSVISKNDLLRLGKTMGFEVIPLRCPPEGPHFRKNLENVINKTIDVDAVYFPSDSFLVSNAELIGRRMREGKIVSIGTIRQYMENGILLGTVPDYFILGAMAAGIIDRHQHGEKLSDIPIQVQRNPVFVINKTTADLLNIKIDAALLNKAILVK